MAQAADAPATPATSTPAAAAPAPTQSATTFYRYAPNDGEYSMPLPEAPTVESIWGDSENIPYLDNPPKDGFIGETATFKRTDMNTEEVFDLTAIFLKADKTYLQSLTQDKIKQLLEKDKQGAVLKDEKFTFSGGGNNPLVWATLSGFTLDHTGHPLFNGYHFLTGQQSILVIKVQYNIENKRFQDYYQHLIDGITYHAP